MALFPLQSDGLQKHSLHVLAAIITIIIGAAIQLWLHFSFYNPAFTSTVFPRIIYLVVILGTGVAVIYLLAGAMFAYSKTKKNIDIRPVVRVFEFISYAVLAIVVVGASGVNVTGFVVGAGFLGIVLGLAAQSTLGNIFGGIIILVSRPFKPGDRITLVTGSSGFSPPSYLHGPWVPGYTGTVVDVGVMYTRLVADDGEPITVPNNMLMQAAVVGRDKKRAAEIEFRMEIAVNKGFERFKSRFIALAKKDKMLDKIIVHEGLSVKIKDMSSTTYGVEVRVPVIGGHAGEAKDRLLIIAHSVVRTM